MRDLEAEMAAALEGKFYWEPAREEDHTANPLEVRIKRAQEKFRSGAGVATPNLSKTEIDRKVDRIIRMVRVNMGVTGKTDKPSILRVVVAFTYDVDPSKIATNSNGKRICAATHHFYWGLIKTHPELPLTAVGTLVGRTHCAVINGRKKFLEDIDNRAIEIEVIDRVLEGLKCGF